MVYEKNNAIIATMILENVYCKKEYRETGVAVKLLEKVIEYAKIINMEILLLGTYEKLERAIKFYEKCGFVEKQELRNPIKQSRYYELNL